MQPVYEIFDHTADMGFRVRAASHSSLLEPAARALYAVIGELVPYGDAERFIWCFQASDQATLLRDFLAELLIRFERDGQMATCVEVHRFSNQELSVSVDLACIDSAQSVADREVKAITYHELAIRTILGGFEASVIVDI